LFRDAGLRHVVEPSVPNPPITLDLRAVPFIQALRAMLHQAGAVYRIEQSGSAGAPVYVIGMLTPTAGPSAAARADVVLPEKRVTLELKDVPLRRALQTLFEGSGFQHAVEPAVPDHPVTLNIHDLPLSVALRQLMNLAPGATYRREGDIYVIGMRPIPTAAPGVSMGFVELELPSGVTEKMSIEGDHLIQSPSGLEVSGSVRIQLSNGTRLTTQGVLVKVETDKASGVTRIRVDPVPASAAP
jgi:hypothetical protein